MNRFSHILYLILFSELAIGGGGRLFAAGPVSLRMLLFMIALLTSVYFFLKGKRLSRDAAHILIFFGAVTTVCLLVGIQNGAERKFWWEDVKPLLFILILPFFEWTLRDGKIVDQSLSIIRVSALIQSVAFIAILLLIHTGVIPFLDFYHVALPTEEFFFRGEITFFYKGFLFVCLAFLIVYIQRDPGHNLMLLILLLVILGCLTRGFIFALALALFTYSALNKKWLRATGFAIISLTVLFFGQSLVHGVSSVLSRATDQAGAKPNERMLGDRAYSDSGRVTQIKEVLMSADLKSVLVGHGFGIGTHSRPVHMEISYAEIFHKQGLLGLSFWGFLFVKLFQRFRACGHTHTSQILFLMAIFVFLQSTTNQYMNNPIGMSVILFSFVGLTSAKHENLYFHS
jgi:hypothetical protein